MSDFFREVDEELRRDKMSEAWKKYGPAVIGLAVAVVVATAGYRFWEWYQARVAGAAGEQYYAAVSGNADTPEALVASLGEVANSGGAFADLARMRVAAAKAQAGDIPAAVSDFDAIAADTGVEKRIRDLAALRAAHLLVDSASVADIKARVEGFTTEDDPLRHFAREAIGLAAYRAGEFAEAATWFDAIIADPATPQDLRGRTQVMQSLLGAKLAATPEGSAQ